MSVFLGLSNKSCCNCLHVLFVSVNQPNQCGMLVNHVRIVIGLYVLSASVCQPSPCCIWSPCPVCVSKIMSHFVSTFRPRQFVDHVRVVVGPHVLSVSVCRPSLFFSVSTLCSCQFVNQVRVVIGLHVLSMSVCQQVRVAFGPRPCHFVSQVCVAIGLHGLAVSLCQENTCCI